MSGNEFLQWTLAIAIWAVLIIPVSVLCGCMVFIVISNQRQARRLGKMAPSIFPPTATVIELRTEKGRRNDLSRWREFGGTLDRPPPPPPFEPKEPA